MFDRVDRCLYLIQHIRIQSLGIRTELKVDDEFGAFVAVRVQGKETCSRVRKKTKKVTKHNETPQHTNASTFERLSSRLQTYCALTRFRLVLIDTDKINRFQNFVKHVLPAILLPYACEYGKRQ
jgi:hypothetical protein